MSAAANNPLMTATPAMPVPASNGRLSKLTPPMATTGMSTAWQMAVSVSRDIWLTLCLVPLPKTAPQPR